MTLVEGFTTAEEEEYGDGEQGKTDENANNSADDDACMVGGG